MATNAKAALIADLLGKRLANQFWPAAGGSLSWRRGSHSSVYDKEVEEEVRPALVPDHVIPPGADKYWGPHPRTGVFGPAAEFHGGETAGGPLAAEQTVWFRPLEDIEKPPPTH